MIKLKLAAIVPSWQLPEGYVSEDFKVDHRLIGVILGRGGEVLREVQEKSGASVAFDREQEGAVGGDTFRIAGRKDQVEAARKMLAAKIEGSRTLSFGGSGAAGGCGAGAAPGAPPPPPESMELRPGEVMHEVPVEQPLVGRIIGKGKQAIKAISDQTGARVQLDQSTQDRGFSIIRVVGGKAEAERALESVTQQLERVRARGDALGDGQPEDEIRIEQRFVGFLIGPGGATFKQIKEQSGALLYIDQGSRDKGYSVIRIGQKGTAQNQAAHELIKAKLAECQSRFPDPSQPPPLLPPPMPVPGPPPPAAPPLPPLGCGDAPGVAPTPALAAAQGVALQPKLGGLPPMPPGAPKVVMPRMRPGTPVGAGALAVAGGESGACSADRQAPEEVDDDEWFARFWRAFGDYFEWWDDDWSFWSTPEWNEPSNVLAAPPLPGLGGKELIPAGLRKQLK
eukprot:TRINITY_DN13753_c0_g1_i1.p1 TRINITY_DN13753_c0_g1~~TRINITY_DN13753_c0_g1_i1.p1  ORF type:complete len:453 (+),score=133.29 TRINITY_DN13753_c0_g1_i1:393-1751(+)